MKKDYMVRLTINLILPVIVEKTAYQEPEIVTIEGDCFAEVKSIDQYGRAEVIFSVPMNTELFQITSLELYVIPYMNWHLGKEGFEMKNLNFTWKMDSFAS